MFSGFNLFYSHIILSFKSTLWD